MIPVLSRRVLVHGVAAAADPQRRHEELRLRQAPPIGQKRHASATRRYTVQMVSQPAWYAVMALPYLMEYPYECTEQTFNRLYANALARHIAQQRPEDPPRLRPVEGHRRRSIARWRRTRT